MTNDYRVVLLSSKLLKSVDLTEYFPGEREFLVFVHCGCVT